MILNKRGNNDESNNDDNNNFIKHSSLPDKDILCGYKYKFSIFTDKYSKDMSIYIIIKVCLFIVFALITFNYKRGIW